MKRKKFIKISSLAMTGGIMGSYLSCSTKKNRNNETMKISEVLTSGRKNWAGNYTFKAEHLYEPGTVSEVQELVKQLAQQKALGSQHCFNNIADSPKNQLSTKNLNKVVGIDKDKKTLTVEAGARYGDFSEELHAQGFALHNLASLPHITVAGACATATHGSGIKNGNLATAVKAIELVMPNGELKQLDKSDPDFDAVVVGLGAFGVITKLTLGVQDTFEIRQNVYLDLPLETLESDFEGIMSSGYSVSLFTDWQDKKVSEVWIKRKVEGDPVKMESDFYGAKAATKNIHPILSLSAESCSEQMGVPGPWYDRLPHFKMEFNPSAGDELQSEFFVPRENAVPAILAVEKLKEQIFPHLLISEIRTIAADDFWMSPCYHQDSVAIHFTWKPHSKEVLALLPKIEETLAPYKGKPHWGKLFTIDPAKLHQQYEKYADFLALAKKYDPEGKFSNQYLAKNIY
jgi:xylitol oxidase